MIKFVVSNSPVVLLAQNPDITIEAEYGDTVVEGTLLTMAHHGSRSHNPAPCSGKYDVPSGTTDIVVGLSHVDLDTIGGCLAVLHGWGPSPDDNYGSIAPGTNPEFQSFWNLASYVDVNGPHRIGTSGASQEDLDRLYAWYAYNESNRFQLPKGEEVVDATQFIENCILVLGQILGGNEVLLQRGREWKKNQDTLNRESFVEYRGDSSFRYILRVSSTFVNHLYTTPDGVVCDAVIGFNTITGAITLSFANPDDDHDDDACQVMQNVFGKKAGGHKGIAGSPRGQRCSFGELVNLVEEVEYIAGM